MNDPQDASVPEKKIALVIGNSNYEAQNKVSGVEDAKAMADALRQMGFTVLDPVLDAHLDVTKTALTNFAGLIYDATTVVLYFSGHGYQSMNRNYLMPTDGTTNPASSLAVDKVLQVFSTAPFSAVKVVILDACRNNLVLPEGASAGAADPGPSPTGVLQAFATSPGSTAPSGSADGRSPYTNALLRYIEQPGLSIEEILAQTAADLVGQQTPFEAFPDAGIPKPFYLRPPVFAQASIEDADDDLAVVLNGKIVLDKDAKGKGDQPLRLNAGDNQLALLVSNQRTFKDAQSWAIPEGWSYHVRLLGPGGVELGDGEAVPFKAGPHHGHMFQVAAANLHVDPVSAKLELRDVDTQIWVRDSPFWARNQVCLWEEKLKDLPAAQTLGLGGGVNLATTIDQILQALQLLGVTKLPNFDKVFVSVWGNAALAPFVEVCMVEQQAARLADLKVSIDAVKAGATKPFDSFDSALSVAFQQAAAKAGSPLQSEDIRVWTALEDKTDDTAAD